MPKLRICPAMLVVVFLSCIVIGSSAQGTLFTSLASFNGTDGAYPYYMSLVQGTDGNFYGTTVSGGGNNTCPLPYGCGTIFKITPAGTLTILHSFGGAEGWNPYAGLVQGSDGNFYGTTVYGGTNCAPYGCGTIFKITPAGTLTTVYRFDGSEDAYPSGPLVQTSDGNFYGTTIWGGGCGTVFKMTPAGTLTTVHTFHAAGGTDPYGGLVQATEGDFYGTTYSGGVSGVGTVFRLGMVRACAICRP